MMGEGTPVSGYGLTSFAATQGAEQGGAAPLESSSIGTTGDISDMSHLDSFFASTGWNREDVLVLAAAAQVGLWLILLYLEVNE